MLAPRPLRDTRTGQGLRGVTTIEDLYRDGPGRAPMPEPDPGPRFRNDPMFVSETVELDSGLKRRISYQVDVPLTHGSTIQAVSPSGNLVTYVIDPFGGRREDGSPILSPGFRVATDEDIASFQALAAELAAGQS